MRKRRVAVGAGVVAVLALSSAGGQASAQAPVPRHLHCLTNEAGTHAIAAGLTQNAPQHAFENFHFNVHLDVFANGPNPHTVVPVAPTGPCPG
jgi:hypothetical protein